METYLDAVGLDTAATEQLPPTPLTTERTETTSKKSKKKLRVMVAIDKSENSLYALEWTLEHLRDVMAAEPETGQEGASAASAINSEPELLRKAREESTANLFTRALEICRGKMVKTETMILEGEPKEMICQAVEQTHVDLLVVGSRSLGLIKRAFLGSVSDYCAHHAICPIVIVRPRRETSTSKQ